MTTVHVVTEHEPDHDEFPVIVKGVFSTDALAVAYIEKLEAAHDDIDADDIDTETLRWEITAIDLDREEL